MLTTTDRTTAQAAQDLLDTMYFATDARDFARSLQAEADKRGKPDRAEYWCQVADILSTASER